MPEPMTATNDAPARERKPMRMLVDNDWLREKIAASPDGADFGAGSAPAPSGSGVREAIARIIDPHSFVPFSPTGSADDAVFAQMVDDSLQDAYRKADRILSALASDASQRGEAVAWRWRFFDDKPSTPWSFTAKIEDVMGLDIQSQPLYAHPAPAPAPAEVVELVEAVKHLSAVSDGVWVQGVSDSEMALLSTAWKRVDAAIAALASPAAASEREGKS